MARTRQTMTISLPEAMSAEVQRVSREEHRTHSELVREALRRYFESRYPLYAPTRAELAAIQKGRAAFRRGDYITLDQLHQEMESRRHQARRKRPRKSS